MRKNDQTKNKILAAALDEFAAKGFAGTRVDQIALAAGVNKAMIYYHFASKEDLFNELFLAEMEQFKQELSAMMARGNVASLEGATQLTRELLDYIGHKKKLLSVLMSGVLLHESIQPQLFHLLDFATSQGLAISRQTGRVPQGFSEDALLHELFTGLLPLIQYVLLRDGLKTYYGWEEAALDERFITGWVRKHAGF